MPQLIRFFSQAQHVVQQHSICEKFPIEKRDRTFEISVKRLLKGAVFIRKV